MKLLFSECVKEKCETSNGEVPSFAPTVATTTLTTTTASVTSGTAMEGPSSEVVERPSSLGKWPDPDASTCGGRRWLLCVSGGAPPGEQYQPFSAPTTPGGGGNSAPTPVCSAPPSSCSLTGCLPPTRSPSPHSPENAPHAPGESITPAPRPLYMSSFCFSVVHDLRHRDPNDTVAP